MSTSAFAMTNVISHPINNYSNNDPLKSSIRYAIKQEKNRADFYTAINPQQGYHTEFNSQNINIQVNNSKQVFSMSLKGIGHGKHITLPSVNHITQSKNNENKINYHRQQGITEWYINRLEGLEQGFTIEEPLASQQSGPLQIQLSFNQQWQAELSPYGLELYQGNEHLSYKKLKVWDSLGIIHSSEMMLVDSHTVSLVVDESNAVYPLYIDPVIQVNKTIGDFYHPTFGWSVSVDENTFVSGDPNGWLGSTSGKMYGYFKVFDANNTLKIRLGYETSDDAHFGHAVAIDGDTLVVGAPYNDVDLEIDAGAAYVYSRNQGGVNEWGFVRQLTPSVNLDDGDQFGFSVAIKNDTIVVGAPGYNKDMNEAAGAVYVFNRDQDGTDNWGEVVQLIATTDFQSGDKFGSSVDIDGNLIVIGAPGYDDVGNSSGAAYIFEYKRPPPPPFVLYSKWLEIKKLFPEDGTGGELFGSSVAIDNDTVIIGAYGDDSDGVLNSGSAYIFQQDHDTVNNWGQVLKITAADGSIDDEFGRSVAISNDTIVVGAALDKDKGLDSGSAYVFQRNLGGIDHWGQLQKILADDGSALDQFGFSVGISGNNIIVGAPYDEDTGDNNKIGAVYTFEIKELQLYALPAIYMLLLN